MKEFLKWVYRRFWVLPQIHRTYRNLTITETFQRIYQTKIWGGEGETFSSGTGSRGPAAKEYCDFVVRFIRDHQVQSVVDLGCGDFAVGATIVQASDVIYMGVDVVPELIAHHRKSVNDPRVKFHCADITRDSLPGADLCLVRQVLQHLSNAEITRVLGNLHGYKLVLISEDVPKRPRSFNRDKPHGPDIRAYYGSGVWVERPPFEIPISLVHEIPLSDSSLLRLVLVTGNPTVARQQILAVRVSDQAQR